MFWRLLKSGCFRNVQYCQLAAVTVGGDDIEAMCQQGSRGKEEGKVSQQLPSDGFGRAHGATSNR
jgi:hypothetical protein